MPHLRAQCWSRVTRRIEAQLSVPGGQRRITRIPSTGQVGRPGRTAFMLPSSGRGSDRTAQSPPLSARPATRVEILQRLGRGRWSGISRPSASPPRASAFVIARPTDHVIGEPTRTIAPPARSAAAATNASTGQPTFHRHSCVRPDGQQHRLCNSDVGRTRPCSVAPPSCVLRESSRTAAQRFCRLIYVRSQFREHGLRRQSPRTAATNLSQNPVPVPQNP
jgi:hypothetical protein